MSEVKQASRSSTSHMVIRTKDQPVNDMREFTIEAYQIVELTDEKGNKTIEKQALHSTSSTSSTTSSTCA